MTWLFKILAPGVSADRFGSAKLVLRSALPPVWVVLLAMAAIGLAVFFYRRQTGVSSIRKYFAAGLRAAFLLLILGLLLRPTLQFDLEGTVRRALIFLADDSASMQIADVRSEEADRKRLLIATGATDPNKGLDGTAPETATGPEDMSRIDVLNAAMTNPKLDLIKKLSADYDIRIFSFAQETGELSNTDWLPKLTGAGRATAHGDALGEVLAKTRGQPLAGIVLLTDGANNSGNVAPLAAAQLAAQQGAGVYVYGIGIASPKDVIVSNVFAQDVAFLEDTVAVAVRVRSTGLEGQPRKLTLKLGDEKVAEEDVTFTGGEQLVSLTFTPKKAGDFKLHATVDPANDEVVKDNNTQSQPIRVVDAKIKILMIEQTPRWEFKYLQALLLRDRRVKLKCVLMDADPAIAKDPNSPYLPRVPTEKAELYEHDLIILGDVDPRNLASGQLEAMNEFVSKLGGGMLVIAGRNHSPHGYRNTLLEKLLPIDLEGATKGAASSGEINDTPMKLELTSAGRRNMMMRLADTEAESIGVWGKLPPIYWEASVPRARPAAEVLLVDSDATRGSRHGKLPIIAIQQYGAGQVCYVGTDNTWRWRRNVGDKYHAQLWGQIVQRLSLPHLLGESKRTQLTADQRTYATGEKVTIFARLFTDTYEPFMDAQVRGHLVHAGATGKQPVTLKPLPDNPGMYRGEFIAREPGEFNFSLERDEKTTLPLTITEPKLELGETAMNEPLLRQIASASGGAFFREEDLHKLPETIRGKSERIKSTLDVELWSSPAYFVTLLVLVTIEWLLRKSMQLK